MPRQHTQNHEFRHGQSEEIDLNRNAFYGVHTVPNQPPAANGFHAVFNASHLPFNAMMPYKYTAFHPEMDS